MIAGNVPGKAPENEQKTTGPDSVQIIRRDKKMRRSFLQSCRK